MIANGLEKNEWKVPADTTLQVVEPPGLKKGPANDEYEAPKNWNGILISLVIITVVVLLITGAAILLVPFQTPPFYGRPLTLQDLSDPTLRASPLGSQWLSDEELVYMYESEGLLLLNVKSNRTKRLISSFTLQQIEVKEFSLSSSRLYVLLTHDIESERLFKRTSKFSIFDLSKNHYYPLKLMKSKLDHPRYQHAQWVRKSNEYIPGTTNQSRNNESISRDAGGSELLVLSDNNIYYLEDPQGSPIPITSDGEETEVFNGVPNLMNEEIMKSSSCVWPSPDGALIAYLSFSDLKVQQIPVIEYGIDGHPNVLTLRYPTVMGVLPEATVWVAKVFPDSKNVTKWRISTPISFLREEHYIIAVGWVNNTKLWISEISRDQSTSHLMTCEAEDWKCTSVYVSHLEGKISPLVENVVWLGEWASFPWPVRTVSGWWYNHVSLVGVGGRRHPTLKLDECHVKEVLASDAERKILYFLGSKLSSGTETQQLYGVSTKLNSLVCISCIVGCARVKASLNTPRLTHAVITCIGTPLPTMHLIDLSFINETIPLHRQPALKKELEKIALPVQLYKKISLSTNVHASVTLTLPPGFAEGDDTLFYPLVIQINGFENYDDSDVEQQIGLQDLLASDHYIAHAKIKFWGSDSSHYNDSIETKALQMGQVIRKFLDKHLFLDSSYISVWGWGSGASLALKLSELGVLNLKCTMAINPVMDWKLYGSYWSERLLGSIFSEGAQRRYEESNILRALDLANGTQILLMQSTKDPLSHHSFGIAQHLISRGMYFQHIVYPEGSLTLRKERSHMIKSFKTFITNHQCVRTYLDRH
ncbi:UNVERIFIED_CONTAM: hypothetical protein RMT77_012356 [Armadillidium vulgare]